MIYKKLSVYLQRWTNSIYSVVGILGAVIGNDVAQHFRNL